VTEEGRYRLTKHTAATREEWLAARGELLTREKEGMTPSSGSAAVTSTTMRTRPVSKPGAHQDHRP
jgi:predicted dithiol-disulfide oxidoreductase (DUF899 family)